VVTGAYGGAEKSHQKEEEKGEGNRHALQWERSEKHWYVDRLEDTTERIQLQPKITSKGKRGKKEKISSKAA